MSWEFGSVSGSQGEFLKIEVVQGENNLQICVSLYGLSNKNSEEVSVPLAKKSLKKSLRKFKKVAKMMKKSQFWHSTYEPPYVLHLFAHQCIGSVGYWSITWTMSHWTEPAKVQQVTMVNHSSAHSRVSETKSETSIQRQPSMFNLAKNGNWACQMVAVKVKMRNWNVSWKINVVLSNFNVASWNSNVASLMSHYKAVMSNRGQQT